MHRTPCALTALPCLASRQALAKLHSTWFGATAADAAEIGFVGTLDQPLYAMLPLLAWKVGCFPHHHHRCCHDHNHPSL